MVVRPTSDSTLGLIGVTPPPALYLRVLDNDHLLFWNNPEFLLEQSTALPGNWTLVSDATSPYSISSSGANQFFRRRCP